MKVLVEFTAQENEGALFNGMVSQVMESLIKNGGQLMSINRVPDNAVVMDPKAAGIGLLEPMRDIEIPEFMKEKRRKAV